MPEQPGYDALAELYDETFPTAYASDLERAAIGLFADEVRRSGLAGPVVDVGCGTGHHAQDLTDRGLRVVGVDPSGSMLARARLRFPDLALVQDDALLRSVWGGDGLSGIVARYSLVHVPPAQTAAVFSAWASRLRAGGVVLVAFQALDDHEPEAVAEFDHAVARAWRWKPSAVVAAMGEVGLSERWRLVSRPSTGYHRFPECHLMMARE